MTCQEDTRISYYSPLKIPPAIHGLPEGSSQATCEKDDTYLLMPGPFAAPLLRFLLHLGFQKVLDRFEELQVRLFKRNKVTRGRDFHELLHLAP